MKHVEFHEAKKFVYNLPLVFESIVDWVDLPQQWLNRVGKGPGECVGRQRADQPDTQETHNDSENINFFT